MDTVKAIVQKVIREGKHGPFAVATSDQLEGSVTFSLEPTVWQEEWPEEGMVVLLGELRRKRAGWRAKKGRFWKPSDEQTQKRARSSEMKNVELIQGKCALCRGPIDEKWSRCPGLGTVCRSCFDRRDEVFGPENVEIHVQKDRHFDPLLGFDEYRFDWRGTKVMVNGKTGAIMEAHCGSSRVHFPDDASGWGTSVHSIDHQRLKDIYKEIGGDTEPPAPSLVPHTPAKAKLLDEPILGITVEAENRRIHSIQIGSRSVGGGLIGARRELPGLHHLHAFANLYVRYKFGLAPNFVAEGGFIGKDFEVRNGGIFTGGTGLIVEMNPLTKEFQSILTPEEFSYLCTLTNMRDAMYQVEQGRSSVVLKEIGAETVLAVWIHVMKTLLRYDWREFDLKTIEGTWAHYCRMQDVLLNIMPVNEIAAALDYCRTHKMVHCGCSF